MTLNDFLNRWQELDWRWSALIILAPAILACLMGFLHGREKAGQAPWNIVYSVLVYLIVFPGVFSFVLTAYSLFFLRTNLLKLNVVIYYLPIVAMIITLAVVRRRVAWNHLPGIDRLFSFVVLVAVSFVIALAVEKTRIFLFFGGSFGTLVIVALICYVLLKVSWKNLFRIQDRPGTNQASNEPGAVNIEKIKHELERIKKDSGLS
ncbi:MAG: hypothetical protein AB1641_01980 [Thermodesulfobacteriota bacterium]